MEQQQTIIPRTEKGQIYLILKGMSQNVLKEQRKGRTQIKYIS
jgi:hypothetical protein